MNKGTISRFAVRGSRPRSLIVGSAVALLVAVEGTAQVVPPQARYSTHDWTADVSGELGFVECWADVKAPGNGRTYTYGTVEVIDTTPGVLFSGVWAQPASGVPLFGPIARKRQVTILQFTNADQTIPVPPTPGQFFFYGLTGGIGSVPADYTRATNARGVSVWAEPAAADTRIVICGDTFDERLPMSQALTGNPLASPTTTSGFIAVLDGTGQLLWTHHFFGTAPEQSCAITDVSVRVVRDQATGVLLQDVVTWCGISSHGNPAGGNGPLTPRAPFIAQTGVPGCSNPTGGAVDNGPGQWDGIIGQLTHVHTNPVAGGQAVPFLSIVGGSQQDALFGIAEAAGGRIVAAGSTANLGTAGSGTNTFPLTTMTCLAPSPMLLQYCLGAVVEFTFVGGVLTLIQANDVGTIGTVVSILGVPTLVRPRHTILRDVIVQPNFGAGADLLVAVGSSDDDVVPTTWTSGLYTGPQMTLNGATDGIILTGWLVAAAGGFAPLASSYQGGPGDDGITGVQGWNEFTDSFTTIAFTDQGPPGPNFDVRSYLVDITAPPAYPQGLYQMTQCTLGGDGVDHPTAMGSSNATNLATPGFNVFGLDDHAGGGITVDSNGRVNVCGTTNSMPPGNYPVQAMGLVAARLRNIAFTPSLADAVRSVLDMLPGTMVPPVSIGRTDGTGPAVPPPMGPYPILGTTGGTTPFCALAPYGVRIGEPAPALQRMLIDFDGIPAPGPTTTQVVVDRPTNGSIIEIVAMQIGFPNLPGFPPLLMPDGTEVWTTNAPAFVWFGAVPGGPQRFNVPSPLPPNPVTFTVQMAYLQLAATIPGGPGAVCTMTTANSLTPAIWVSY